MGAEATLQQIMASGVEGAPVNDTVLFSAQKMKNRYMRQLVDQMRNKGMSESGIITALLMIDEMIETDKAPENVFDMFK